MIDWVDCDDRLPGKTPRCLLLNVYEPSKPETTVTFFTTPASPEKNDVIVGLWGYIKNRIEEDEEKTVYSKKWLFKDMDDNRLVLNVVKWAELPEAPKVKDGKDD